MYVREPHFTGVATEVSSEVTDPHTVNSLPSKTVPRDPEIGICIPGGAMWRRGWDRILTGWTLTTQGKYPLVSILYRLTATRCEILSGTFWGN